MREELVLNLVLILHFFLRVLKGAKSLFQVWS